MPYKDRTSPETRAKIQAYRERRRDAQNCLIGLAAEYNAGIVDAVQAIIDLAPTAQEALGQWIAWRPFVSSNDTHIWRGHTIPKEWAAPTGTTFCASDMSTYRMGASTRLQAIDSQHWPNTVFVHDYSLGLKGGHMADETVTIHIDRTSFQVPAHAVTGAMVRSLQTPPISNADELFRVAPEGGEDLVVRDDEIVEVEEGTRFFTAPRMILAGGLLDGLGFPESDQEYIANRWRREFS